MKKLLLTLAVLTAGAFSASADSYTIQFKADATSNNIGTEIKATTMVSEVVESGADYVASFTDFTQAYAACNSGLKIGANKQAGNVTVNLSEIGKVDATKSKFTLLQARTPLIRSLM